MDELVFRAEQAAEHLQVSVFVIVMREAMVVVNDLECVASFVKIFNLK